MRISSGFVNGFLNFRFASRLLKMVLQVQEIVDTYSSYAAIPSPATAVLLPGINKDSFLIHSTWTTRDLKRAELTRLSRCHVVNSRDKKLSVLPSDHPQDSSSECLVAFSPSGKKKAVLRDVVEKGVKCQYIEIWNSTRKIKTYTVKSIKSHGKIYDDSQFGCFCWSQTEELLLYVAEEKQQKHESFFETAFDGDGDSHSNNESVIRGEDSLYSEDWGESLVGKHHSVVCVMNIQTGHVKVLSTPGDITAGQAIFAKNDKGVIHVGWYENPRRLGITYCSNRRSGIFFADIETGESHLLSSNSATVWSPRLSNDNNSLIYLENEVLGPHRKCNKIMKYDFQTKQISTVVDIQHASGPTFSGIFAENLPHRCWSEDGKHMMLSTIQRSKQIIICVDIVSGKVQPLEIDDSIGHITVLDVKNDMIIASASSPNTEPFLMIGEFSCTGGNAMVNWTSLDKGTPCTISGFKWSIMSITPPDDNKNTDYPGIDYEALLLIPDSVDSSIPLILWPHGGPHSAFTARFQLYSTVFIKLGFAVCMVNYRGSIGFGENGVNSLPGRIGAQDVKDVHFVAETLKARGDFSISSLILFGGSHGGFLVTHLSHKYSDFYNACICRNPVINISAMVESTDIPDWSWVESGLGQKFDFSAIPCPEVLTSMWEVSPIVNIRKACIPTLILLGKNDRRVPPSQAMNYFYLLRAKSVPVRMHVYDDNHALSKVGVEADCFVQIMLWLSDILIDNVLKIAL